MDPKHAEAARRLMIGRLRLVPELHSERRDSVEGIDTTAAARLIGVSQSALSVFLKKGRGGGLKLLLGFADRFDVSLDDLLGRPRRAVSELDAALVYHRGDIAPRVEAEAKREEAAGLTMTAREWAEHMLEMQTRPIELGPETKALREKIMREKEQRRLNRTTDEPPSNDEQGGGKKRTKRTG